MEKGTLRQILLITDGCSNEGEDPVAMAALAREEGITVNVIGVIEDDPIGERGLKEIEAIAASGGGISQVVYTEKLARTVQMVTRKAMTQTIQGVVNRELQNILGEDEIMDDLPPEKRGKVMEMVDELGETMDLEVVILVDTSASMKTKLPTVQEALKDLSLSLNARIGKNRFALYTFPGKKKDVARILDWTPKIEAIDQTLTKLSSGGVTPTGPALREVLSCFKRKRRSLLKDDAPGYLEEPGS